MLTNYYSTCQSTIILYRSDIFKLNRRHLFVRYKRIDEHLQSIKRNFVTYNNDRLIFSDTITNVSTILNNNQQRTTNRLKKALIIFISFVGSIILISITMILVFVCTKCSRPSRINKLISIEYLNSNEMINHLEESSSIDTQSQLSINSLTSLQYSHI
ncbi:unnamed protein product [Rotaria sp. Silwood1]|nr:unnamed protein product [Rotaria sp. Silwood1]CAF1403112.1 unnamed protein product [Rotaria sp. Silwood1]CAF1404095.1 unnamed protein product [Rotaria sp. Silwood1]CAF3512761.1 unnamed protein product [Rotaria sp. Silwood1]CAF3612292.1 unnamed protein product [Rotaria sp. Silwood1]